MKQVAAAAAGLVLALFLMPVLLVQGEPAALAGSPESEGPAVLPAVPTPAQPPDEPSGGTDQMDTLRVLMGDGQVETMTMADYLWSVVAAEMPASFEAEALAAQAVTARTYAVWKQGAGEANHPQADVCTDITCCQAFLSPADAAANWGNAAGAYTEKIRAAVAATDGEIITYNGAPIQAVFFSSSGGRTEDAVAVWGNAVPYLVGVDSPEGDDVPNYRTDVTLTAEEFRTVLLGHYPQADLSGPTEGWFQNRTLTASGAVDTIEIGGVSLRGTQVRALFSLRSANFTVEAGADAVTFHVTGYGHGVGMSQYGANALAKEGKSYREILTWYYTGVEVEQRSP